MPKKKKVETPERTYDQLYYALKKKVRMFYDAQRLRMQCGGRLSKDPRKDEIVLHEFDLMVLSKHADSLRDQEDQALCDIKENLEAISFYKDVLSDKVRYRGVGPTMAGVILSEFDIRKCDNPSQMWSFAGLAPVPAFRCNECKQVLKDTDGELKHPKTKIKCEFNSKVMAEGSYHESGKAMKPVKGEKLPYNKFLRTKLVGVLAPVLLKCKSPWTKIYYNRKQYRINSGWGVSDGHRHHDAMRYMIKMLLLDIWMKWREHEGLEVRPSYQEEKLGHKYSGGDILASYTEPEEDVDPEVEAELMIASV